MFFLPKLLAVLAMLLPVGSGGMLDPIVLGPSPAQHATWIPGNPDLFFSPAHLPCPNESFFEHLDEMAFDEEDSTRVEDHGIAPLPFLDFEASVSDNFFGFVLPANPHFSFPVVTPILRC